MNPRLAAPSCGARGSAAGLRGCTAGSRAAIRASSNQRVRMTVRVSFRTRRGSGDPSNVVPGSRLESCSFHAVHHDVVIEAVSV